MSKLTGSGEPIVAPGDYADLLNHELPADKRQAAHFWLEFGFVPIPIVPKIKVTATKWEPWTAALTHTAIDEHWAKHPDHDVGCLVDDRFFILDADSPEAVAALYSIEKSFEAHPNLVVKTKKGEHHYFKRKAGTFARMDSHPTELHPERLDVRTGRGKGIGRSMIILPPSSGKSTELFEARDASELTEVNQLFIDAIFQHNGRNPPRLPTPSAAAVAVAAHPDADKVRKLLSYINSHCGRQDWFNVLTALHHTFGGSDEGLAIADAWSSTAANYCGPEALAYQWHSFDGFSGTPITIATIIKMAKDRGCNVAAIMGTEEFTPTEYVRVEPPDDVVGEPTQNVTAGPSTPAAIELAGYALNGMSAEFEANMLTDTFVLGEMALLGQYTIIFAKYNTGKTLITLWLVIDAIKRGFVRPEDVYYVNADDFHAGLTEKLKLAEEYGFNLLAPGYLDFKSSKLLGILQRLSAQDSARGVIVIVDTLKKVCALTDKSVVAGFGSAMREFVMKGGTFIALGHVNKKPGPDGRPIAEGPADLVSDADCSYIIESLGDDGATKTVQFTNVKDRGRVARTVAYSYSIAKSISYFELVASVQLVPLPEIAALREPEFQSDQAFKPGLVAAIQSAIRDGISTKMKLADEAARLSKESKSKALQAMEHYTGRLWEFTRVGRGAHQFRLIDGGNAEGGSTDTKPQAGAK